MPPRTTWPEAVWHLSMIAVGVILPVQRISWSKTVPSALARLPMLAFPMSCRHRPDGDAAEFLDDLLQLSVVPVDVECRMPILAGNVDELLLD